MASGDTPGRSIDYERMLRDAGWDVCITAFTNANVVHACRDGSCVEASAQDWPQAWAAVWASACSIDGRGLSPVTGNPWRES